MLALVKKLTKLGKIVFPWEASLQHYDPAFEDTPSMKVANISLLNTTSKPRRGYCSTRTEARADISLICSDHKHSSQYELQGAGGWFGRKSSQTAPLTGQSIVKCLLITVRSQGAGLGLP